MAGDVVITIRGVDKMSDVLVKIGKHAKDSGRDLEKLGRDGKKMGDDIERGAKKADTALRTFERTSLAVGAALGAMALATIRVSAASQQQERQMAAIGRLYGEAGDRAIQYAESIQTATRFSNDAARESLVLLNTLTRNYDFSQTQIEQLLMRSADLAQLHGRTLTEVTQMVSNALRGEGEYIEQIGVTMNQSFVAAEAAARGMENFISEMSAGEQAAFRFQLLMEQTGDAQGYATERAQGMSGAIALLMNEVGDATQSFGGWLGPVRDLAAEFNNYALWMPLIASQTARVSAILINAARSGELAARTMSILQFAMSPLGLAIGAVAAGGALLGLKMLEWHRESEQLAQAWKEAGEAAKVLEDQILSLYTAGSLEAARWADAQNTAFQQTLSGWNELALGMAEELGSGRGLFLDDQGNILGGTEADQAARDLYNKIRIQPDEQADIQQALGKVFSLTTNEYIDQDAFRSDLSAFLDDIWADLEAGTLRGDQVSERIDAFYERWVKSASDANKQMADLEWDFKIDDLLNKGVTNQTITQMEQLRDVFKSLAEEQTRLVESSTTATTPFDGILPDLATLTLTQTNLESFTKSYERLLDAVSSEEFDSAALLSDFLALVEAYRAGTISQDAFIAGMSALASDTNSFQLEADEAASSAKKMNDELARTKGLAIESATALKQAGEEMAEERRQQLQEFFDAQKQMQADFISTYTSAFGMDDPLSQINMSSLTNQFTQLAEAIGNAGNTMDTVFRVIVGNTNAIGQQAQGVYDWAEALINVEGELGKIDDLMQKGLLTQTQYAQAQTAFNDIARENVEIQDNILRIQAMQAPFIRDHMVALENTTNELADQSAEQQRITLGWMDSATAAQAYTLITQAAQVANGELGESGAAAFKAMIEGAIAVNPFLFDMLESIGLVQGTMDDFTISFDGITEGVSEIERLTMSIDALNETLGGTPPEIDVGVDVDDTGLDGLIAKLQGLDTSDREINVKTNFDMGSTGGPLEGLINDMFGGKSVTLAPINVPVIPEWQGNASVGDGTGGAGLDTLDPITVPVEPEFDMAQIYDEIPTDTVPGPTIQFNYDLTLVTGALISYSGVHVAGPIVEFGADVDEVTTAQNTWGQSARIIGPLVEFGANTDEPARALGEWVSKGTVTGPTIQFIGDAASPARLLLNYTGMGAVGGPIITFGADDNAPARALGEWVSKGSVGGPVIVFTADTSSVEGALARYSGSGVIGTRYVDIVTRTIGGGLPKFAHGGVLGNMVPFVAAEGNNPEIAHFANGGSTVLDREGVYLAPPATLITPSNAVRGTGHGQINVYINTGDFYGGSRPDLDDWAVRALIPAVAEEFARERLASGMDS